MQSVSVEFYLQLRARYPSAPEHEPVTVTLEELSGLWHCTPRNVKLIIRKLADQGWIEWQPGRGRGNASRVVFMLPQEELLLERSRGLVQRGQLNEALESLNRYGAETAAKGRFMAWWNDYFGYTRETSDNCCIETLRLPMFRPILKLDPAETFFSFDGFLARQLYDTLVLYDKERDRIEPSLAHYWEVNEERTVWRFFIRRGVLFHHGRELNARDVVYSFERCRMAVAPTSQRWCFQGVREIQALNDRCVRIELDSPNHLFLRYLCLTAASILPADLAKEGESFFRHPVGTGPFSVRRLTDDKLDLEANTGYFRGRAHLDRVEITVLPAEHEPRAALDKSWSQLLVNHGDVVSPSGNEWQEIHSLMDGCSLLSFNLNKRGPQRSRSFRQALHHLIDRAAMVKELGRDRKSPAYGLVPGERLRETDDAYDPGLAERLLKEGNYAGEPFRIAAYERHEADARWLQERCAAYGIRAEVDIYSWEGLLDPDAVLQADAILYQIVLEEGEASRMEMLLRDGQYVQMHMSPELARQVKAKANALLRLPSEEERGRIFQELERQLADEYALLFLVHKTVNTSYNRSLRGIRFNSFGWVDFKDIWFQEETGAPYFE